MMENETLNRGATFQEIIQWLEWRAGEEKSPLAANEFARVAVEFRLRLTNTDSQADVESPIDEDDEDEDLSNKLPDQLIEAALHDQETLPITSRELTISWDDPTPDDYSLFIKSWYAGDPENYLSNGIVTGENEHIITGLRQGELRVEVSTIRNLPNGQPDYVSPFHQRVYVYQIKPSVPKRASLLRESGLREHGFASNFGRLELDVPEEERRDKPLTLSNISNRVLDARHIVYTNPDLGKSGKRIHFLRLFNCHNLELNGWIVRSDPKNRGKAKYHAYKRGAGTSHAIYIHRDCTNITLNGCNILGATQNIWNNGAGTHLINSYVGDYHSHGFLFVNCGSSNSRDMLVDGCVFHASKWTGVREQSISIDNCNYYAPGRARHGGHIHRNNTIMGGGGGAAFQDNGKWKNGGGNGSGIIVIDGPEGKNGGGLMDVYGNYVFDGGNKAFGIASQNDCKIHDNIAYQGATYRGQISETARASNGGVSCYLADFKTGGETRGQTRFEGHRIENNIIHWTVYGLDPAGRNQSRLSQPLGMIYRDASWAWGHPNKNNFIRNNTDTNKSRAQLMEDARNRHLELQIYSISGEENVDWWDTE